MHADVDAVRAPARYWQRHGTIILRGRRAYPIKRRRKMGMNRKLWLTAEKMLFSQPFHRDTKLWNVNFLLSFGLREMAMNCVIQANVSLRYDRIVPVDKPWAEIHRFAFSVYRAIWNERRPGRCLP
jgi:hypothetical protein